MKHYLTPLFFLILLSCDSNITTQDIEGKWSFYRYETIGNTLSESELDNEYEEYISDQNNNFEYTFFSNGNYEYKIYGHLVSKGKYKITDETNLMIEDTIDKETEKFKILYLNKNYMQLNPEKERSYIYIYFRNKKR